MPKSSRTLSILLLAFLYLLYNNQVRSQSLSLALSVTTINANSIYNFTINDNNLANINGNIIIGFPTGIYTLGTLSCYNTYNVSQAFPCTPGAGNLVTIVYTKTAFASSLLSLSISTIKNPSSQQSLNFTYVFTTLTAAPPTAFVIVNPLTPDSLISCSVSFSPSTVYTQATATFSLTTKNPLDINGSITITFPTTWTYSASSVFQPLMSTTSTCTKVSGSVLYSTLSCSVLTLYQYISVQSAFATSVPTNTALVFTATGIMTPPSSYAGNTITISTSMSNGNLVDSSSCSVAAVSSQPITPSTTSSFTIGSPGLLSLSWTTNSPLIVGDTLTLALPANYMTYYDYIGTVITYGSSKIVLRSISNGNSSQ